MSAHAKTSESLCKKSRMGLVQQTAIKLVQKEFFGPIYIDMSVPPPEVPIERILEAVLMASDQPISLTKLSQLLPNASYFQYIIAGEPRHKHCLYWKSNVIVDLWIKV